MRLRAIDSVPFSSLATGRVFRSWSALRTAVKDLRLNDHGLLRGRGGCAGAIRDMVKRAFAAVWYCRQRLAMYQELRKEAQQANTPAGHDAFYESHLWFVDLVNEAAVGGGRFAAKTPKSR